LSDIAEKLRTVRRYTGDAFSAARGYSLNKKLNFGQRMAVERYFQKIMELTAKETVTYIPKRGEKTEAFAYTGQTGWRKFKYAIIHKPDRNAKLSFSIDKTRPRGSRFVVTNRLTGQRYYHIPSAAFLWFEDMQLPAPLTDWLKAQDIDPTTLNEEEFYQLVIEFYAEDAEFFLIQAGESYMWGAGGGPEQVAKKIATIINNYGEALFDASNPNSSYYGNWFRGVTGFTNRFDAFEGISEAMAKRRAWREKYKVRTPENTTYRTLSDGSIGVFVDGVYTQERFYPQSYKGSGDHGKKTKKRRKARLGR